MARDDAQVNFRMPLALKERLEAASVKNRRSLTAEIVGRLEDSLLSDQLGDVARDGDFRPPTARELKRVAEIIVILERNALDEKSGDKLEAFHEEASRKPRNRKP